MEQSEDIIPQQHFHGALKLQGRSLSSLAHLVLAGIEPALATAYFQTEGRKTSKADPHLLSVERISNIKFTAKYKHHPALQNKKDCESLNTNP
jgi:hypothetical protein